MKLTVSNSTIIFDDGNNSFEIFRMADNDIMFMSNSSNASCLLRFESRDTDEYRAAEIFGSLMREIIGQYILDSDNTNWSLPKDFVDLEEKLITWHSDSDMDNILEIAYINRSIILSITKDSKSTNDAVRIRSNGSSYGTYYQHFQDLHTNLLL